MDNPIRKIMDSKYKYAIIGVIIALIIFTIGAVVITQLDSMVQEKQISYAEFTVTDKYIDEEGNHFYMVISDENETFEINNDTEGSEIFKQLEIGKHYHFVTQKEGTSETTHIIQVYNESE